MKKHVQGSYFMTVAITGIVAVLTASAIAQTSPAPAAPSPWAKPTLPGGISVSLIRQDSSDCANSTVADDPNRTSGGEVWVTRENNGMTTVQVGMTASPATTYHFYLKCVQQLGDVVTDDDGIGLATFSFPTSAVGSTFAFDMYPEGAPAGNKFQSMTVTFP